MDKYTQLTEDLKRAREAAAPLGTTEDGGTCNFDALELELPRWNEVKTQAAIKAAGLGGWKSTIYRTPVYIIPPRDGGQANARTRQAEAMRTFMQSRGYDAHVYYAMD